MSYLDPTGAASVSALMVGLMVLVFGLYARRQGRLHTRQGAEVLAGFAAVMSVATMAVARRFSVVFSLLAASIAERCKKAVPLNQLI